MHVFLFILTNNIIPIFTLIVLGYFMSRKFDLNIDTLSKLNFYVFVPAFMIVNLYTTEIPFEMVKVLIVTVLILLINTLVAGLLSKFRGYNEGLKNAFINSVIFYNSGNIGIPLITLVFSSPPFIINGETPYLNIALTAQIMIMVIQNITSNSLGFLNAGRAHAEFKECLVKVLKMPTIYIIPMALILKMVPYDMTEVFIWPALEYARNALVPTSLIALGVQLSKTKFVFTNKEVYLAVITRLIVGPLLALVLIYLLQIDGIVAQVLVIAAGLPTSVNSALIAVEFDNYPDFASQVVMTSTLLSAVTLSLIIYLARGVFYVI